MTSEPLPALNPEQNGPPDPAHSPWKRSEARRLRLGPLLFGGTLLFAGGCSRVQAEKSQPSPPPESAAFVRLWNFNAPENQSLILMEDRSAASPLLETPANSVSAGYVPVESGTHRLRLQSTPEDVDPLLRCILRVKERNFVTLLVVWQDGTPEIRLLDETRPAAPLTSGSLSVRHFIPGAAIWVQGPGLPPPKAISYRGDQTFTDLIRGLIPLRLRAGISGQPRSEWTILADLSHCASQTLLLVLDPYGRFRPRLVPSGQCELQPDAPDAPTIEHAPPPAGTPVLK
jgi:hypothetical protein